MGSSARGQAARLPLGPGVYRFRDATGRVLYLGRAASLRRRVVSYWGDLRDRRHLVPMVSRIVRVEAVACDSAHEAAWLERNLLRARKPPWNRAPDGGQEAEVWLRLRDCARTPGVSVVYERAGSGDDRHFGPYLGSKQARLAVSGLCHVLPLNYAGSELAGTQRELARARGVTAVDRAALTAQIAAVLDRDPVAVADLRGQLIARRDAASSALAFELAARLQQEAEALDWITAVQRVTRPAPEDPAGQDPADHDACGWSDGLLVRFAVRAGRLTGWTQRACGESAGRRHCTATIPAWHDFAQRNAELAARLAQPGARTPTER